MVDIGLLPLFSCYKSSFCEYHIQVLCGYTFLFLLGIYLRVELLGHLITVLTLLRNHQIFFQSSCLILQSYLCLRFQFSPHSHQHIFFHLLILASLGVVKLYLVVVLISIYLMANEVDHLSICFLAICIFSLEKCLFRFFSHFLHWVIFLFII